MSIKKWIKLFLVQKYQVKINSNNKLFETCFLFTNWYPRCVYKLINYLKQEEKNEDYC